MVANFLIIVILFYLAIRLLALLALIFRRLNRRQTVTQNIFTKSFSGIF